MTIIDDGSTLGSAYALHVCFALTAGPPASIGFVVDASDGLARVLLEEHAPPEVRFGDWEEGDLHIFALCFTDGVALLDAWRHLSGREIVNTSPTLAELAQEVGVVAPLLYRACITIAGGRAVLCNLALGADTREAS